MSPESSNPNATGNVIVPTPTPAGAGSPEAMTAVGMPPPGGATQIVVLTELGGLVKATAPALFKKAVAPSKGFNGFPVVTGWMLQVPEVAAETGKNVPSLLPMKRPFQRLISIWPLAFSPGTINDKGAPTRIVPPTGTPGKKHPVHGGGGGGGLSLKPTIRTAAAPTGRM